MAHPDLGVGYQVVCLLLTEIIHVVWVVIVIVLDSFRFLLLARHHLHIHVRDVASHIVLLDPPTRLDLLCGHLHAYSGRNGRVFFAAFVVGVLV